MKSIFNPEFRDQAFDRIATGICEASKNSAIVIKKINTICQNPKKFDDPHDYIDKWRSHLFSNFIHDLSDDWLCPKLILPEDQAKLENTFFSFFVSYLPICFEGSRINPWNKKQSYIWTDDDFKELKVKVVSKWYEPKWNEASPDIRPDILEQTQRTYQLLNYISKSNKKMLLNRKQIEPYDHYAGINSTVSEAMPKYDYRFQKDLFSLYTARFLDTFDGILGRYVENFYEVGTYLYKYFVWSISPFK